MPFLFCCSFASAATKKLRWGADIQSGAPYSYKSPDDPNKVIEMIQKMCSPETWEDKDVSISADANKLVVRQYPSVQKEIMHLLALLRASR